MRRRSACTRPVERPHTSRYRRGRRSLRATLVLRAACPDGLGAEDGRGLASSSAPWTALLEGPPPTGAGAQRAVILALVARRYRLVVEGCRTLSRFAVGIDVQMSRVERPATWLRVARPFQQIPQLADPPTTG